MSQDAEDKQGSLIKAYNEIYRLKRRMRNIERELKELGVLRPIICRGKVDQEDIGGGNTGPHIV